jgi:hypothetical protein
MVQVIVGGIDDPLNNAADEYNSLMSGFSWVDAANAVNRYQLIPCPGTLSNFAVELTGAPGTNPYRFTIYKNGVASALVTDVLAAATTGIDSAHSVAVAAGDYVYIESSRPSGNPDNAPKARWSCRFTPANAGESIVMGNGYTSIAGALYGLVVSAAGQSTGTEEEAYQIIPTGGTLRDLYVRLHAAPGPDDTDGFTVKLRVDGADSDDGVGNPLSVTITKADGQAGSDTAHNIAVVAGNYVDIEMDIADTPTSALVAAWGMVFAPTIDGESIIMGGTGASPDDAAVRYHEVLGTYHGSSWDAAENPVQQLMADVILRKFYVMLQTAPGVGNTLTFDIRKNGPASTGIQVAITGAATSGNDTAHTYTAADYDELDLMVTPDSTPSVGRCFWGLVTYNAAVPPRASNASRLIAAGFM